MIRKLTTDDCNISIVNTDIPVSEKHSPTCVNATVFTHCKIEITVTYGIFEVKETLQYGSYDSEEKFRDSVVFNIAVEGALRKLDKVIATAASDILLLTFP